MCFKINVVRRLMVMQISGHVLFTSGEWTVGLISDIHTCPSLYSPAGILKTSYSQKLLGQHIDFNSAFPL